MTDAISRSALRETLNKFKLSDDCMKHKWAIQAADDVEKYTIAAIKNAPALDVAPVVRCKDCKKRGMRFCPMAHVYEKLSVDARGIIDREYVRIDNTTDEGFCHTGERKDT